jgi:EpsI family protein
MEKKAFFGIIVILAATFFITAALRFYRPEVQKSANLKAIPLEKSEWVGTEYDINESAIALLNPDQLFSAIYTNSLGKSVHLFVDYYSPSNKSGVIHSPRNCMPGSGWAIIKTENRKFGFNGKEFSGHRIHLQRAGQEQVMDFWYVTRYGETANDYVFKLYSMLSSLTFRPTDRAFVRFVTFSDESSLAAMNDFESLFLKDIYSTLPF